MNRHIVTLAAALMFALPGLIAQAQRQPSPSTIPAGVSGHDYLVAQAHRFAAMAEDMEVMKSILDEALEAAYGRSPLLGIDATGALVEKPQGGQTRIPDALVAYLEGHGVVYQLTAPRLFEEPEKKKADTVAAKSVTRWEATRQRLEGKTDASAQAQADAPRKSWPLGFEVRYPRTRPTKSILVEGLLDMLAENGHNFRELKPDEQVSIAITFSKDEKPVDGRQKAGGQASFGGYATGMPGGSAPYNSMGMGGGEYAGEMEEDSMMGPGPGGMMGSGGMMGAMGASDEEGGYGDMGMGMGGMEGAGGMSEMYGMSSGMGFGSAANAGDLHLRQGNYQKAVEAYEKVIGNAVKADPYKHTPASQHVPLYQKLIQALVGNAQYGEAQQLMKAVEEARAKPAGSGDAGSRFPTRLVVSATKADLDQVAAGKMTRQEFDKRATVEYVDPHAVKAEEQKAPLTSFPGPPALNQPAEVPEFGSRPERR